MSSTQVCEAIYCSERCFEHGFCITHFFDQRYRDIIFQRMMQNPPKVTDFKPKENKQNNMTEIEKQELETRKQIDIRKCKFEGCYALAISTEPPDRFCKNHYPKQFWNGSAETKQCSAFGCRYVADHGVLCGKHYFANFHGTEEGKNPVPTKKHISHEALELIFGDRRQSYGDVKESFQAIADAWNVLLRSKLKDKELLNAQDVAKLMIQFKLLRENNQPKRDNRVDIVGYAELLDQLCELQPTSSKPTEG